MAHGSLHTGSEMRVCSIDPDRKLGDRKYKSRGPDRWIRDRIEAEREMCRTSEIETGLQFDQTACRCWPVGQWPVLMK